MQTTSSKWFIPAVCVALGAALAVAELIGGDSAGAAWAIGVMVAAAALLLTLGRRSETLRGLGGPGRDERFRMIDVEATAFAGTVVILALIAGFAVEAAKGHSGAPYNWLCAVAGIAYVAGVAVLQRRR